MILTDHIDLLAARDYRTLMKKTKLKEDELKEVLFDRRPSDADE